MDKKYTNTEIKRFNKVIDLGYTTNESLLFGRNRAGYNSGTYGWNYDVYTVYSPKYGRVALLRGYRVPTSISEYCPIEISNKYAKKATEAIKKGGKRETIEKRVDAILEKFIDAVLTWEPKKKPVAQKPTCKSAK